jgi:hypothetical protein
MSIAQRYCVKAKCFFYLDAPNLGQSFAVFDNNSVFGVITGFCFVTSA